MTENLPRKGAIKLGNVFSRAKKNDKDAVQMLFAGFLGKNETIVDCGYLGALGFIFPEYSFWCVTNLRVCGLLVRRGGRMEFTSGLLKLINSMHLRQASLINLWVLLTIWLVFAGLMIFSAVAPFFGLIPGANIFLPPSLVALSIFISFLPLLATRWVIRIYYRIFKSGVFFWMRESIPIRIFADRKQLSEAQRLITVFTDERQKFL